MEDIEVLHQLREDHTSLRMMLFVMEREAESPQGPTLDLLAEVLDYCDAYAERVHHPREDLIYERLCSVPGRLSARVGDLMREHAELEELSRETRSAVEAARLGDLHSASELHRQLRRFVDAYRRHMAQEEDFLFPAACIHLGYRDWEHINERVANHGDPLFGAEVRAHFGNLRHRLDRMIAGMS